MPKRVLIADDAAFMRELLREILIDGGYEVVAEAGNGAETLALVEQHRPDALTLDVVMPGECGLDILRRLGCVAPEVRVVMCSALGQESLVMEVLQAGACGYVVKPFKPHQLLNAMGLALRNSAEG